MGESKDNVQPNEYLCLWATFTDQIWANLGKSLSPTYQQGNPLVSSVGRLQTMAPGTICPAVLLRQPPGPQSPILPRPWGSGVQSLLVGVS